MSGKEKDIAILRCPFVWDESSLLRHIEALDVEQFAVGDACLGVAAGKDGSVALECNEVGEGYGGFALFEVGRINQLEVGGEGQGDAADGVVVDGVIQIPNAEDATVYRAELIAAFIDAAVDLYAVGAVDAGDDDVLTVNDDGVAFFQLRDFHGIVAVVIVDDHRQLVAAVFGDEVLVQIKVDLQGAVGQVGEVNVGSHRFHTQRLRGGSIACRRRFIDLRGKSRRGRGRFTDSRDSAASA